MKLRKLKIEDAPLMLEWMHDRSVVQDLQTDFASKTIDDCRRFIENSIDESEKIYCISELIRQGAADTGTFDGSCSLNLAITDENDEYLGTVSLKHIYNDTAEFGIAIRSKAMGKGLAKKAMEEIIRHGSERFGMKTLYWCVDEKNKRALRFYDKNCYERVKIDGTEISSIITGLGTYPLEKINQYVWYVKNHRTPAG